MTEIGRSKDELPVLDNYEQGADWSSLIFQTIFELEKNSLCLLVFTVFNSKNLIILKFKLKY